MATMTPVTALVALAVALIAPLLYEAHTLNVHPRTLNTKVGAIGGMLRRHISDLPLSHPSGDIILIFIYRLVSVGRPYLLQSDIFKVLQIILC